jgi:ABC-type Mn2+/Zn2+ transport system ATPase subunit
MTIINTSALGVTLGDTLFSNLNLTISKADRIGLVAANGRGKSTLLGCLAGEYEYTTGEIFDASRSLADRHSVLYLTKSIPFQAGMSGPADRTLGSQMFKHLLFQHTTGLNKQTSIDCFV